MIVPLIVTGDYVRDAIAEIRKSRRQQPPALVALNQKSNLAAKNHTPSTAVQRIVL